MFDKGGRWSHCPNDGNTRKGTKIWRCRFDDCEGVYCQACAKWGANCPHCGQFSGWGGHYLGKIDPRAGPFTGEWRPKPARVSPPPPPPPPGTPGISQWWLEDDEAGEIEFPEWTAAPPNAPKLGHEPPPKGYSAENALKALERSNVNRDRPQDTAQAEHLAKYCVWVLKGKAAGFIQAAARDDALPKKARAFYQHAAQILSRKGDLG